MAEHAVWAREIEELEQRRKWAHQMGGADALVPHTSSGRLTIRGRETRSYRARCVETAYSTLGTKLGPKPRDGGRP